MNRTVEQLAKDVGAWCDEHRVVPANGQVATGTSVRTLRYYRTMGLLDAPGADGYGRRHFLQACAVRVLQAEGLPLTRIQALTFGRGDDALQSILDAATTGLASAFPAFSESAAVVRPETWQTWPVTPEVLVISRRSGYRLTSAQIEAIRAILENPNPATSARPSDH